MRAVKAADGSYSTASGEPVAGDVTYMTVGGKPNTAFLRGSSVPLDEKNHIQVRLLLSGVSALSTCTWPGLRCSWCDMLSLSAMQVRGCTLAQDTGTELAC